MSQPQSAHLLYFPNGDTYGNLQDDPALRELALTAYRQRKNQTFTHEDQDYFARIFPPKSQLIIVGAAHITADLVQLGNFFGFETVVIDPRGIFTGKTRFATPPDKLLENWPEEVLKDFPLDDYTFTVMLTHDPKIDDQALHLLLRSGVAYIGALGSKRTHEKRVGRLREAGFTDDEIDRIQAPIGVDINAKSAREIALSIMAQIVQVKNRYL